MLNRRALRIKVMQNLYACEQRKKTVVQPTPTDIASAESPPPEPSTETKKEKPTIFENTLQPDTDQKSVPPIPASSTVKIQQKSDAYDKDTVTRLSGNMITETEKIHYWYHSVLQLLVSFVDVAFTDQKTDCQPFVKNLFIESMRNSDELKNKIKQEPTRPHDEQERVENWYHSIIAKDPSYKDHNQMKTPTLEDQRLIVKHLVRKAILEGTIGDYFFEKNIMWEVDRKIVRNLIEKTLKSFDPKTGEIALQKLSLDWGNDRTFMKVLFEKTLTIEEEKSILIAQNTRNWEVDRLPLIDRIILEMAIVELAYFPEIPTKVTINEYIELAKRYSTPNSPKFVNGIIDVIAKKMQTMNIIKKSGKGLIDNK